MVLIRSDEYNAAMITIIASGDRAMSTFERILKLARRPISTVLSGRFLWRQANLNLDHKMPELLACPSHDSKSSVMGAKWSSAPFRLRSFPVQQMRHYRPMNVFPYSLRLPSSKQPPLAVYTAGS